MNELEFNLEKMINLNYNLESQVKLYMYNDSLNTSQIEDYIRLVKLKDDMIKVVKPKWYENRYLWFFFGVALTATSVKLAGEITD